MSEPLADVAAERAVLAGIFAYGADAYSDIADILTTRTFTLSSNQLIFRCFEHLLKDSANGQVDFASVMSAAQSLGMHQAFDRPGELDHLRAISRFPVQKDNVRRLAGKVRKLEIARLLDTQLELARGNVQGVTGEETIDQILGMAEGPVFDFTSLLSEQSTGPRRMGEGAEAYIQYLMDNPREMLGISTGMVRYDRALGGGLRPNGMDVIASRPKIGKSFFSDNVALHIAGTVRVPVLNVDTEMTWEEHLHRIIAHLSGVPIHDIETGKAGVHEVPKQKALEAARRLRDMPYDYDCIIGKAFEDVMANMRRWVMRTVGLDDNGKAKPCVIIYDYIKMLSADFLSADLKEYQALGFIATALKNFAGRFGVPILCFCQLNRDGIDREDSGVVAGSDRILHYCTSLSLYKCKSDEERAETTGEAVKYTHKLLVTDSRHGDGLRDGDYINILADYAHGRIIEGPTRRELERGGDLGRQPRGIIVDEHEQESVSFAT